MEKISNFQKTPFKVVLIGSIIIWTLTSYHSHSHECIPASNSATDIFIYNSCKSDLLTGASGHKNTDDAARIEALEQENQLLKSQLKELKAHLLQIISQY